MNREVKSGSWSGNRSREYVMRSKELVVEWECNEWRSRELVMV